MGQVDYGHAICQGPSSEAREAGCAGTGDAEGRAGEYGETGEGRGSCRSWFVWRAGTDHARRQLII